MYSLDNYKNESVISSILEKQIRSCFQLIKVPNRKYSMVTFNFDQLKISAKVFEQSRQTYLVQAGIYDLNSDTLEKIIQNILNQSNDRAKQYLVGQWVDQFVKYLVECEHKGSGDPLDFDDLEDVNKETFKSLIIASKQKNPVLTLISFAHNIRNCFAIPYACDFFDDNLLNLCTSFYQSIQSNNNSHNFLITVLDENEDKILNASQLVASDWNLVKEDINDNKTTENKM